MGGTAAPTVTATLLSEFPHVELPADADTLTISGIKVVALDSDGTGLAAPATISVEVIDDEPSVEISADTTVGAATDTTDTVAEDGADLSGAITLVEGADQDATLVVSLTGATGGPLTFTLDGTAQSQSATVTTVARRAWRSDDCDCGERDGDVDVQSDAGLRPRRSVVQLHGDGDGCGRRR